MTHEKNDKILYKDESYQIQGAIFEVYKEMGCGFLEPVYQECLEKELYSRSIHFIAQQPLILSYKGEKLKQRFKRNHESHKNSRKRKFVNSFFVNFRSFRG